MRHISLAGLNKPVSCLIMGTLGMRSEADARVSELLDLFYEFGGTAIDTARVYQSESVVGRWIQRRGVRDDLVLIGKGGHPSAGTPRLNPVDIRSDLIASLESLGLDHFDLFMLHRDDPAMPVADLVEVLHDLAVAGLTRTVGVSNWSSARIESANDYARINERTRIVASSPNLALAHQNCEQYPDALSISNQPDELSWYTTRQLPVLAWSAQARGFFTKRASPEDLLDSDLAKVYYCPDNWERKRRAELLGRSRGKSAAQIALAWVVHQPFPCAAIIGPAELHEAEESYRAAAIDLSVEEVQWLNEGGQAPADLDRRP